MDLVSESSSRYSGVTVVSHLWGGLWRAPLAKSAHPASFPDAASGLSRGRPAPVEDGRIAGGQDELGMVPEIEVGLEGELADLKVEPITMLKQWRWMQLCSKWNQLTRLL